MPTLRDVVTRLVGDLSRLADLWREGGPFGPLLVDRGHGLIYDVERDITWLQDANHARTVGRTADGQLRWNDAMAWVQGLSYRGIVGWRLPNARNADGSGPCEGENCNGSEIGHLFLVAAARKSPPDLSLRNFDPSSIYWFATEASPTEAFAFKMTGLKQGRLAKDPWAGDFPVPLIDKVLAWPVHDGDVGAGLLSRLLRILLDLFRRPG